jgi:hypothetical protein
MEQNNKKLNGDSWLYWKSWTLLERLTQLELCCGMGFYFTFLYFLTLGTLGTLGTLI